MIFEIILKVIKFLDIMLFEIMKIKNYWKIVYKIVEKRKGCFWNLGF